MAGRQRPSGDTEGGCIMDYNPYFDRALGQLHDRAPLSSFADLARLAGKFSCHMACPRMVRADVVIWCSNDYLGMGQHPKVVARDGRGRRTHGRRIGRHPQYRR